MEKLYAISFVWKKENSSGFNILNSLRVVKSNSIDEAIGFAYTEAKKDNKDHDLMFHTIVEINEEEL